MELKITKAKLTKENHLEISYQELTNTENSQKDEIERKSSRVAHRDLIQCYSDLRIHMATIAEQAEYRDLYEDKDLLDVFKATHISLGGDGEHEGVTITGQKKLRTGMVLNIQAPFTKFNPDHSDYANAESLDMTIKALLSEISQYLDGTKYAPSADPDQMDLFDGNGSVSAEGGEKKSRRKRQTKTPAELEAAKVESNGEEAEM